MPSSIDLHPRLCPNNFWDNSCNRHDDCDKLHIRMRYRELVIFNAAANLSRIDRKLKNSTLENMRMPSDCSLYVVDSQVDPEDYGQEFTFRNKNIHVARAIGLHPSVRAPSAYLQKLHSHLKKLDFSYGLAYIGPFGGADQSSISGDEIYTALKFAQDFNHKAAPGRTRAVAISSNDDYLLNFFTTSQEALRPVRSTQDFFLWKTAGRCGLPQLNHIMESLKENPYHFATFDGELSQEVRDAILRAFHQSSGRRCLLESVSPSVRTASPKELLPLSVVNTIVELFLDFRRKSSFHSLGYSLAVFNNLFTENGFRCIPMSRFVEINQRALARITSSVLRPAYYDHIYGSRGTPSAKKATPLTARTPSLMSLLTAPSSAVSQRVHSPATLDSPQKLWNAFSSFMAAYQPPPIVAPLTESAHLTARQAPALHRLLDMGQILPTPPRVSCAVGAAVSPRAGPAPAVVVDTGSSPSDTCSSLSPTLLDYNGKDEEEFIRRLDEVDGCSASVISPKPEKKGASPSPVAPVTQNKVLKDANQTLPRVIEEVIDLTTGKTTIITQISASSTSTVTKPTAKRVRSAESGKENGSAPDLTKFKRVKVMLSPLKIKKEKGAEAAPTTD